MVLDITSSLHHYWTHRWCMPYPTYMYRTHTNLSLKNGREVIVSKEDCQLSFLHHTSQFTDTCVGRWNLSIWRGMVEVCCSEVCCHLWYLLETLQRGYLNKQNTLKCNVGPNEGFVAIRKSLEYLSQTFT